MADIPSFMQLFRDAVVVLTSLRLAWLGSRHILRPGQLSVPKLSSPKALRNAILRGDVTAGDRVTVKGYVSRYAHLVMPVSYLSSCTDIERTVRLRQRIPHAIMSVNWKASQLPVTCLPVTQAEKGLLNTLFLYPTSFNGFTYRKALNPKDNLTSLAMGGDQPLKPRIAIPEQAWPFPVLVPAGKPGLPVEVKVEITATVEELPSEILKQLEPVYKSHFQVDYLSNFLQLGKERILSHCLRLDSAESEVKVIKKADLTHRMILYVEGHFENTADDPAVSEAIAGLLPVHPATGGGNLMMIGSPDKQGRRMLATPEGIHLFIKPPAIVGLYGETNPAHGLANVHETMVAHYRALGVAGQEKLADWSTGERPRLALDFVYDYGRQWDFDVEGVWESPRAAQVLSDDRDFADTKQWLKNQT